MDTGLSTAFSGCPPPESLSDPWADHGFLRNFRSLWLRYRLMPSSSRGCVSSRNNVPIPERDMRPSTGQKAVGNGLAVLHGTEVVVVAVSLPPHSGLCSSPRPPEGPDRPGSLSPRNAPCPIRTGVLASNDRPSCDRFSQFRRSMPLAERASLFCWCR